MLEPALLDSRPFVPHDYDELIRAGALATPPIPRELYARAVAGFAAQNAYQVERIAYKSGGFTVTGIRLSPQRKMPKGHPIILFNRGGNREYGRLTVLTVLRTLLPLALQNNAVIYASNYRGADGGEGQDEFGGAEVEDVLELLRIARADPAWNGRHSLMAGHSRGGMMTALALKAGAEVNAAVLSAGVSDVAQSAVERPEMVAKVFAQVMPGFTGDVQEHYRQRSAVCWPEALRVPILLLHGDADTRVNVMQSIRLAQGLAAIRHPHTLVVYKGDDHSLSHNWGKALQRMGEWMRQYA